MLSFIKNNEELQKRLSWRYKTSANRNKSENLSANPEIISDFPPTFSLKLEETNLANILNHVDPAALDPFFYTSHASKVLTQ